MSTRRRLAARCTGGLLALLLIAMGIRILANAWNIRRSINEFQETFVVIFVTVLFFGPAGLLVYFAARR